MLRFLVRCWWLVKALSLSNISPPNEFWVDEKAVQVEHWQGGETTTGSLWWTVCCVSVFVCVSVGCSCRFHVFLFQPPSSILLPSSVSRSLEFLSHSSRFFAVPPWIFFPRRFVPFLLFCHSRQIQRFPRVLREALGIVGKHRTWKLPEIVVLVCALYLLVDIEGRWCAYLNGGLFMGHACVLVSCAIAHLECRPYADSWTMRWQNIPSNGSYVCLSPKFVPWTIIFPRIGCYSKCFHSVPVNPVGVISSMKSWTHLTHVAFWVKYDQPTVNISNCQLDSSYL